MQDKKEAIKAIVKRMIQESVVAMEAKLTAILEKTTLDKEVEEWDQHHLQAVLPAAITTSLLEYEVTQRDGKGTAFEKYQKGVVKKLRYS